MNRLTSEKSPYLLQHKDNPVDWHPWGEEAFAEARRRNTPVFLSVGYSTCHWCHVMAHESFENPQIAALMNEHFVNIKVDREERPDVDRLHMAFVQATTGSGGWPMSVWLTPEGKPFFGGTYFPPENRYGRAGFPSILTQIARLWREDAARIEREGARAIAALSQAASVKYGRFDRQGSALEKGFAAFAGAFDETQGGFGDAPKFPRPAVFNFLLRFAGQNASDQASAREMVFFTLKRMAAGGMRDHLGGGFHRYSVDARWHVPHFEKMLYDQAQLAVACTEAWQVSQDDAFREIARNTLDYVRRDLRHPEGGFFSAEDADSLIEAGRPEHREGAFYVWTKEEILAALGEADGEIFCRHFGVTAEGNVRPESDPHGEFTGKNILFERENSRDPLVERGKAVLFQRRLARPRPHLDDKILTAWNGLMISAFAKAGAAFDDRHYLETAAAAAGFVRAQLTSGDRLLRSWRDGPGSVPGFAEDYAFLIQGLLDLYEASFEARWLQWAVTLQGVQDEIFGSEAGYFSSAPDPLIPVRMQDDYDGAEPSANSVSAGNLIRLARMLDEPAREERARKIIAAHENALQRAPAAVPQMLVALGFALAPRAQGVIAGSRDSTGVHEWIVRLHRDFHPYRVLLFADEAGPSGAAMQPVNDQPALYLCENFVCLAPQTLS